MQYHWRHHHLEYAADADALDVSAPGGFAHNRVIFPACVVGMPVDRHRAALKHSSVSAKYGIHACASAKDLLMPSKILAPVTTDGCSTYTALSTHLHPLHLPDLPPNSLWALIYHSGCIEAVRSL